MSETISPVAVLDLDNTLIKTREMFVAATPGLCEGIGIGPEQFTEDSQAHYHRDTVSGLHHYDYFGQMASYGVEAEQAKKMFREATGPTETFLFDDVPQFLIEAQEKGMVPKILTYGERRFQLLKTSLFPVLGGLCVDTVLEPKGPYMRKKYRGRSGIIIDDLKIRNVPPRFTHFVIDRNEEATGQGYITSLGEVWEQEAA